MKLRRLRALGAALTAAGLIVTVPQGGASGHSPTGGESEYPDSIPAEFWFGDGTAGVAWFRTAVEIGIDDDFEISNNSRTELQSR